MLCVFILVGNDAKGDGHFWLIFLKNNINKIKNKSNIDNYFFKCYINNRNTKEEI